MPNIDTLIVILKALKALASAARDARYLLELVGEVRAWVKRKRQQHQQDSAEQK